MPSAGGFQFTADDVEILTHVFRHRMLHVEHLALLTGRHPKRVHRRLVPLAANRYLARVTLPFRKHLYFIGTAGVPILVREGIAPKELAQARLRHHELKPLFLDHLGMIVDLHVVLRLAGREGPIRVTNWSQGRELWDSAGEDLPVQPDAFFTLQDGRRPEGKDRRYFFLEADRSTMAHERIQRKFVAYWRYLNDGRHTARYGIKTFRVLTVTLNQARARGLCEAAAAVLPKEAGRFFLFGSLDSFSLATPSPILGDVFVSMEGVATRLMPSPQPLQAPARAVE